MYTDKQIITDLGHLIPGLEEFINPPTATIEAPSFNPNLFQDVKVVPKRKKIEVTYEPEWDDPSPPGLNPQETR